MGEDVVLVWTLADSSANDILKGLMRQAKYKWVWRKLNNARWHLIETHTWQEPFHGQTFVTNGDVL